MDEMTFRDLNVLPISLQYFKQIKTATPNDQALLVHHQSQLNSINGSSAVSDTSSSTTTIKQ
jgi:hypothetical protein